MARPSRDFLSRSLFTSGNGGWGPNLRLPEWPADPNDTLPQLPEYDEKARLEALHNMLSARCLPPELINSILSQPVSRWGLNGWHSPQLDICLYSRYQQREPEDTSVAPIRTLQYRKLDGENATMPPPFFPSTSRYLFDYTRYPAPYKFSGSWIPLQKPWLRQTSGPVRFPEWDGYTRLSSYGIPETRYRVHKDCTEKECFDRGKTERVSAFAILLDLSVEPCRESKDVQLRLYCTGASKDHNRDYEEYCERHGIRPKPEPRQQSSPIDTFVDLPKIEKWHGRKTEILWLRRDDATSEEAKRFWNRVDRKLLSYPYRKGEYDYLKLYLYGGDLFLFRVLIEAYGC